MKELNRDKVRLEELLQMRENEALKFKSEKEAVYKEN